MPRKFLTCAALIALTLPWVWGCDSQTGSSDLNGQDGTEITIPPYAKGTVSEFAVILGGGSLPLQAHGLIVGLGQNGSSEVPAGIYNAMSEYLSKQKLGSYQTRTERIPPERILVDRDTAVVLVGGSAEIGAPVGSKFDVFVSALPGTQTRSLDGGVLMPVDMSVAYGGVSDPNITAQIWGSAAGPVFINPFVDADSPEADSNLLTGRVIGGGVVTRRQPIRLQLHRPDAQLAQTIQRRIHTRFGLGEKLLLSDVVKGRSRSMLEVTVPASYEDDYRHFMDLITHLPVRYGVGGQERYTRRLCEQMEMPLARHDDLSLVLEAIGRQVLPQIKTLYSSQMQAAAYYTARAGLRLGDMGASSIVLKYAASAESPFQLEAIAEMGRHPKVLKAGPVLRSLLDDRNEQVRLAAYKALRRRGDRTIRTITLPDQFTIDIVRTKRDYTVYATQTGDPRIVLFGENMPVRQPVYFVSPDELVTVNAFADSEKLTVFRKVPHNGRRSDPVECGFTVRELAETMGRLPEPDSYGKVHSLGLSYSQVVGVLYRLCESEAIPARFVLQQTDSMRRIYGGGAAVGRPDMPE